MQLSVFEVDNPKIKISYVAYNQGFEYGILFPFLPNKLYVCVFTRLLIHRQYFRYHLADFF
jgi:hypothetical protein